MTVVKDEVHQAVLKELEAAERTHGLHHSDAEKYAVMLKELQEAGEELAHARERLAGFWSGVRLNREDWTTQQAVRIAEAAERAACECVQLAAMARKAVGLIAPLRRSEGGDA